MLSGQQHAKILLNVGGALLLLGVLLALVGGGAPNQAAPVPFGELREHPPHPSPPTADDPATGASPVDLGAAVFAPWGERYYYAGTYVGRQEGRAQVVFEDGDQTTVSFDELRVGLLQNGVQVGVSRDGRFEDAVIVGNDGRGLYNVRRAGMTEWVAPMRLRVSVGGRMRMLPAHAVTDRPGLVARFRGAQHWYPAAVRWEGRGFDRVALVFYADGTHERLAMQHVRTSPIRAFQTVQVRAGEQWLNAVVNAVAGRAVQVIVEGRSVWFPLGKVRLTDEAVRRSGAEPAIVEQASP